MGTVKTVKQKKFDNVHSMPLSVLSPKSFSKNKSHQKWKCFYCDYSAENKRNLDAHILSHDGNNRPWQCLFCGKSFMEREHLIVHTKSHQHQNIFSCSRCFFTTHKKSLLNMHSRHHLG